GEMGLWRRRWTWIACATACVLLYSLGVFERIPFHLANGPAKYLAAASIVVPAGFVAGIFFPLGLVLISKEELGRALLWDAFGAFFALGLFLCLAGFLG